MLKEVKCPAQVLVSGKVWSWTQVYFTANVYGIPWVNGQIFLSPTFLIFERGIILSWKTIGGLCQIMLLKVPGQGVCISVDTRIISFFPFLVKQWS
jgi:hypothetical protein